MAVLRRLASLCGLAALVWAPAFAQIVPPSFPNSSASAPSSGVVLSSTDRKEIVRKAQRSYYSLKTEGLDEFQCRVQPEWDSIYKDLPVDPTVRDQLLPILKKIHFQVVVGPEGALSVIPETDVATAEVANRVKGTVSDTEKILTGFLHTWLLFAIAPPLPEVNSDYQVRDIDGKYRLNYKEGSGDVSTSMKHDFAIEELSFSSAEFTSTVLPNLLLDEKGFLLAGYSTSYIGKSNSLQMSVTIEYQEVQGIKMPSTVTAIVPLPAGKVTPSFKFSEYQVKTH